jgi:hypothetical protein
MTPSEIPHALTSEAISHAIGVASSGPEQYTVDRDWMLRILHQARAAIQLPDELVRLRAEVKALRERVRALHPFAVLADWLFETEEDFYLVPASDDDDMLNEYWEAYAGNVFATGNTPSEAIAALAAALNLGREIGSNTP